jgi:hypothetical protein
MTGAIWKRGLIELTAAWRWKGQRTKKSGKRIGPEEKKSVAARIFRNG